MTDPAPGEPCAIDLFCGLGGWTEGLLLEGYRVIGFDTVRHCYGDARYPGQLVLQDVLTLHGSQFKDAALIVASPPCQAYSYRAMPWKKAKALPPPDNALFEACFRLQREANDVADHFIPLVVENVCGAQKWVGRARWRYGSFYLWGDVPALMPITRGVLKLGVAHRSNGETNFHGSAARATKNDGVKVSTMGAGWYPPDHPKHAAGLAFNGHAERNLRAHNTTSGHGPNPDGRLSNSIANAADGCKQRGSGAAWWRGEVGSKGSHSSARQAASAHIAKIPLALARHIGRAWWPPRVSEYADNRPAGTR